MTSLVGVEEQCLIRGGWYLPGIVSVKPFHVFPEKAVKASESTTSPRLVWKMKKVTSMTKSFQDYVRMLIGIKDLAVSQRHLDMMYTPERIVIHPKVTWIWFFLKNFASFNYVAVPSRAWLWWWSGLGQAWPGLEVEQGRDANMPCQESIIPWYISNPANIVNVTDQCQHNFRFKGFAFVAGWGSKHDFSCTTGQEGPSPYTECKFPFYYIGIPFFKCSHIPSPSSKDRLCKALIKKEKLKKFPPTGFTQVFKIHHN